MNNNYLENQSMHKLTQSNKNLFFNSVSLGEIYSFSQSLSLQEIKKLAEKVGISIDYVAKNQFIIKEREQSPSLWQPEEDDLCHGYETGFCGRKAIICIGNSSQGYLMFCRNCAYKMSINLINIAFTSSS
ncbi:hypothetical protein [Chroococcidiopsis sp. CCNUC1]|uniref:hypothetical protein n=1 Tax=Chroococcidiopsis sp. CCNUC1 TaxID=2653189 RepID=UPI0020202A3F|nr:hypothetical protein [Chroococcidiopsis sp. CCNUC1]URD53771.1 hypothetical protein M5J74_32265 [Chroococcidiopsis sp. CCNUC1]